MSHCIVIARLPFISVQRSSTANQYSIKTVLYESDDVEHDANLSLYMERGPPQEGSLFELEVTFASNSGSDATLASDFRAMEPLGTGSPGSPGYLATCPDLIAPLFNVLGTVGSPDDHTFTLTGSSYINQTDVMPKLRRNRADVGIDLNARSTQGRLGRSGPKASEARNWIKHKSLGSLNEKCGTCEESNDQAYKARKSEREDRGYTQTRTKVSGPEPS
ncbi:hypothetical protein GGX14DRAFT_407845 [Mycena pura]|uniref:Uncharacterized protein n=1 Tax=Mycena pura TaxID=153505 RepID=A0AAD6UUI8_9AGAR|nr:hypothetical protein GGX14DRAFT_407845 [Mycena pura]